jgi:hypothetical protein
MLISRAVEECIFCILGLLLFAWRRVITWAWIDRAQKAIFWKHYRHARSLCGRKWAVCTAVKARECVHSMDSIRKQLLCDNSIIYTNVEGWRMWIAWCENISKQQNSDSRIMCSTADDRCSKSYVRRAAVLEVGVESFQLLPVDRLE